jgi:RNA polymerase sigma-70 factor (ECF subfamily)
MDEGALKEIEPALVAYARRAVRDAELARDLVQETIVAALAASRPFEGRSQLRTWLIGILSHKVIDHFRKQSRERARQGDAEPDDLTSPASGAWPEQKAARNQALQTLDAALRRLGEAERMAVLMVDVEGLEHAEACNALDVTATHLRVLLHRARHRLRKELEHVHLRHS